MCRIRNSYAQPVSLRVLNYCGQRGFSLLELSVVVVILGIVALVAIPNYSATDTVKLDLAAEITAETMRFARSEAIRRGAPVGFSQHSVNQRLRVFRLDTNTSPWTPIFDIYHPISKQLYDVYLDQESIARVDSFAVSPDFRGSCNTADQVYFDANGMARCADPETVLVNHYQVTLTLGGHARIVSLDGISGRVSIQ